jgi:hypothetical protein
MHLNKAALRGREPDPSEPPSYRADAGAEGATLTGSTPVSAAVFRWLASTWPSVQLATSKSPWV